MSQVTKFAARDAGPAARMAGFLAHLRANGLRLGVQETEVALRSLTHVNATDPVECCRALKAVCTGCAEEAQRFDDLFDAFWRNGGRVAQRVQTTHSQPESTSVKSSRLRDGARAEGVGETYSSDGDGDGDGEQTDGDGTGKLTATDTRTLKKTDLRDLVRKEDITEAEQVARRMGAALRDRRARRRRAARKGDRLHFRNVLRHSLSTGGEPLRLYHKTRPDRALRFVAICDVSGSMTLYSRVFLAFLAGLMRADPDSDAYLFHTRLVRITEALRDKDALRAMGRLSVMAEGLGGGSKIGASLTTFSRGYARRFVDGRTVVMILSDGFDTDAPDRIGTALARLRKRGCRILWLNPLKGWRSYEPVARGMAAALPHLNLFHPANRLEDLDALQSELARL